MPIVSGAKRARSACKRAMVGDRPPVSTIAHLLFAVRLEFTVSGDHRILCRNDFDSMAANNVSLLTGQVETLKTLDCQKLLNSTNIIPKTELLSNELSKANSSENTSRQTSLLQRKKSSRISTSNKMSSSLDELDSNDERHKSTDDSSSLSPNGSSSQPLNTSSAERRPRRDKQQRVRTVLTEKQLHLLKSCYAYNARPDALLKEQLAEMTELSPRVIRVWFQNKRCKDKKKTAAQQARFPGDPKVEDLPFELDNTLRSAPLSSVIVLTCHPCHHWVPTVNRTCSVIR